jgi:predicted MFS family arabinose efflux permease
MRTETRWERRRPTPLLDVRLFSDRRFSGAAVAVFVLFMADYVVFFLANQYLNYVLGWGPAHAGLALVPPVLGTVIAIPFVPLLLRRCGARVTIALALLVCALGAGLLVAMAGSGSYMAIAPGMFVFWMGLGIGMAPPTEGILNSLPDAKHGVASAVNDLSRELGAALGIAVAGAAFNAGYRFDVRSALASHTSSLSKTMIDSPAAALQAIGKAAGHNETRLRAIITHGVLQGWRIAFIISAAALLLGAIFVARRYPGRAAERELGRSITQMGPSIPDEHRSSDAGGAASERWSCLVG